MSFFRRPDYQSEATQFIEQLKANNPALEAEQRAGRALLWDQHINRDQAAQARTAQVAQQPYVYQTEPSAR